MIKTIKVDRIDATLTTSFDNEPMLVMSFYSAKDYFGEVIEIRKYLKDDKASFDFIKKICLKKLKNDIEQLSVLSFDKIINNETFYFMYFKPIREIIVKQEKLREPEIMDFVFYEFG